MDLILNINQTGITMMAPSRIYLPAQFMTSSVTSSILLNVSGTFSISSTGSILKKLSTSPTQSEAIISFQIKPDVDLSINHSQKNNL